jgi:hypothetical protein
MTERIRPNNQKMRYAATHVFTHPDQKAQIVVPDGSRMLLLVYGESPKLAPIDEPGEYEVEAECLSKGRWPAAVIVIDLAHVGMWLKISPAKIGEILDGCAAEVARRGIK